MGGANGRVRMNGGGRDGLQRTHSVLFQLLLFESFVNQMPTRQGHELQVRTPQASCHACACDHHVLYFAPLRSRLWAPHLGNGKQITPRCRSRPGERLHGGAS